jgi:hypothetical protein
MARKMKVHARADASLRSPEPRLSGSERLKGLSPLEKQRVVAESFKRKVEIMEAMAERPWSAGDWWPSTLEELRNWNDQERGLIEWSDRHVDTPSGPNSKLRDRFDVAKKILNARSPLRLLEKAREENQLLKAERNALSMQNLMLMAELRSLRDKLSQTMTVMHSAPIRPYPIGK